VEDRLVVAVGGDLFEIAVPGFARVDPEPLGGFAEQQFPRAFDVGGGKRLAVVPLDALPQHEFELRLIVVPRPACS
jgi:hypothetical protein